ncbi:F-box/kelch-repeat protein At1g15670 [Linum grandiflorum]
MTKSKHSSPELIPGLPDDIAMECLIRLHFTSHAVASQVCRRWRHLVRSRDFYRHRRNTGHTRKAACLIHALSVPEPNNKPVGPTKYGLTMFDPVTGSWERLESVPEYPAGLPLFCRVVSSEGKLVVMGGWDPVDYHPVRHVSVYDFTTRKWRQGKAMPEPRSFFAAAAAHGKVVVAGGHDESKNALRSAWVYDVCVDEWEELPPMSQERDECEAVAIGSEVWVVGGYRTDRQGQFELSAEAIEWRNQGVSDHSRSAIATNIGELTWRRVEDVWKGGRCPRSCLAVRTNSNGEEKAVELFDWAEMGGGEVKVGACGVELGSGMTLVSGSAYQGGPQGFYIVEGQDGKWNKLSVPPEFAGFVQSGCCIEV